MRMAIVANLLRRDRVLSLDEVWAERLGIDAADRAERADRLEHELHARFEHLARFVLGTEMPPAGKLTSAAGDKYATAYGDLWVLTGFLADARHLMSGEQDEEARR